MISPAHVQVMARYNSWQNRSLLAAASALTDAQRTADRGAFFKSIHATLSHLVFADQAWMHRFEPSHPAFPAPLAKSIAESVSLFPDWSELTRVRTALDHEIERWAETMAPTALDGALTWYSGAMKRDVTRPRWLLITHMFNHQTHHRGQVHAMLTSLGANPEATDIPFMPSLN